MTEELNEITGEVKVACNICKKGRVAKYAAKDREEADMLIESIKSNYICGPCLEDPGNMEQIKKVLKILPNPE